MVWATPFSVNCVVVVSSGVEGGVASSVGAIVKVGRSIESIRATEEEYEAQ
jgi:hypothetical protein